MNGFRSEFLRKLENWKIEKGEEEKKGKRCEF